MSASRSPSALTSPFRPYPDPRLRYLRSFPFAFVTAAISGRFDLAAGRRLHTVDFGGLSGTGLTYSGFFPGPTVVATAGQSASITLRNSLSEETTIPWHGMVVPHAADGHPMDAVAPGGSYLYAFNANPRASLNWYHPHPHMLTGRQVALGLAGAFIIRDTVESELGLPAGQPYEVPLVVRDASFDSAGNLTYTAKSSGFMGREPLVNGTRRPALAVDRAVYRFRILAASNARVWRFGLDNGVSFHLIGNDGGLLPAAASVPEIVMSPGERVDVLVDLRGASAGSRIGLVDRNSGWTVLELNVGPGTGGMTGPLPATLSSVSPLTGRSTVTREFSFDGMSRMNGREFDMNRIDFTVPTSRYGPAPAGGARCSPGSRSGRTPYFLRTAKAWTCSFGSTASAASTCSTATSWSTRTWG